MGGVGLAENKANSALLELELWLSVAIQFSKESLISKSYTAQTTQNIFINLGAVFT